MLAPTFKQSYKLDFKSRIEVGFFHQTSPSCTRLQKWLSYGTTFAELNSTLTLSLNSALGRQNSTLTKSLFAGVIAKIIQWSKVLIVWLISTCFFANNYLNAPQSKCVYCVKICWVHQCIHLHMRKISKLTILSIKRSFLSWDTTRNFTEFVFLGNFLWWHLQCIVISKGNPIKYI